MKNFLIGFFGAFFGIVITVSAGIGTGLVAYYFIWDKFFACLSGLGMVVCILVWLLIAFDDDVKAKEGMLYRVQIGDETFYCKEIKHEEDTDTVLILMDGIYSRVSLDTDIIISKI